MKRLAEWFKRLFESRLDRRLRELQSISPYWNEDYSLTPTKNPGEFVRGAGFRPEDLGKIQYFDLDDDGQLIPLEPGQSATRITPGWFQVTTIKSD